MNHRFDISRISGLNLKLGTPINRSNARHLPELIEYAISALHKAERMPHATVEQTKAKAAAVEEAKRVLDERQQKLALYREIFPDLLDKNQ
jgi:hypothetical protein